MDIQVVNAFFSLITLSSKAPGLSSSPTTRRVVYHFLRNEVPWAIWLQNWFFTLLFPCILLMFKRCSQPSDHEGSSRSGPCSHSCEQRIQNRAPTLQAHGKRRGRNSAFQHPYYTSRPKREKCKLSHHMKKKGKCSKSQQKSSFLRWWLVRHYLNKKLLFHTLKEMEIHSVYKTPYWKSPFNHPLCSSLMVTGTSQRFLHLLHYSHHAFIYIPLGIVEHRRKHAKYRTEEWETANVIQTLWALGFPN